jgi:4-amino-4-deoxy-L-arabinose transferase-like glycosyltransferase
MMKELFSNHPKATCGLLLMALVVRLFFVMSCPHVAGDSPIYEGFARNLLHYGVYSHYGPEQGTPPAPSMIRTPGYPLFLAAVFAMADDQNERAIRMVQALLDTFTCLLIALLVLEIAGGEPARRERLALWALFLSALCPFIANYAASILTEVPTTFLLTAATLFAVRGFKDPSPKVNWICCGLLTGAASMFRPESGLLLVSVGISLLARAALRQAWRSIMIPGLLLAVGLTAAMLPWTARNLLSLKTFQPLAPVYAEDVNEFVPRGYMDWCRTWLWQFRDVDYFLWTLEESDIRIDALPERATDSAKQREEVVALLSRHNASHTMEPDMDEAFSALALESRHRHPIRYYVLLPTLRALSMWFTPRSEILNLEGRLLPFRDAWENDPQDFSFTLLLFFINLVYVALAWVGAWMILKHRRSTNSLEPWGLALIVAIVLVRTSFIACTNFPEPRYVLEAYPGIIALGAFAFSRKPGMRVPSHHVTL